VRDFLVPLRPHSTEQTHLRVARVTTIVASLLITGIAVVMARLNVNPARLTLLLQAQGAIGGRAILDSLGGSFQISRRYIAPSPRLMRRVIRL